MEDLLTHILSHIASQPDSVSIKREEEDGIIRFNLTAHDEDYARIIGRKGLTIKAITETLRLYEAKNNPENRSKIFINITEKDSASTDSLSE